MAPELRIVARAVNWPRMKDMKGPVMSQLPSRQIFDLALLDPIGELIRVPGLLRRWEISEVIEGAAEYRIEEAGELADRTPVFTVYRRARRPPASELGVPVTLNLDGDELTLPARVVWLETEAPKLMGVMPDVQSPRDAAAFARLTERLARCPAGDDESSPVAPGTTTRPAPDRPGGLDGPVIVTMPRPEPPQLGRQGEA